MGILSKSFEEARQVRHPLTISSESKALTTGTEGKELQAKAWAEILEVLEQQATEVRTIIQRA